ncbi:hypothetical protein HJG60_010722 [Phyllostomus discolor]|uniref:Uncharacterized protein n=1 Tax=Phyllostomus discolor TaxID=89673 RepID=A0A834ARY1_9CHIR|nr:hypothetical protein HJG60_010722 [Phyllostomus discolor]
MQGPEPLEPSWGGPAGVGRSWGNSPSLHSRAVEAGLFCVTGPAPGEISFVLLRAQTRWCLGLWEDRREQYSAPGCGALRWPWLGNGHEDAPSLVMCGGGCGTGFCGEPLFSLESGILQMAWTPSMCRSLSHKETNKN